jgi:predicted alpha/beta superfamily hydrolase
MTRKLKALAWWTGLVTLLVTFLGLAGCNSLQGIEAQAHFSSDDKVKTWMSKSVSTEDKEEFRMNMVTGKLAAPLAGSLISYREFPSNLIRPRHVDVWLPEGYDSASSDRYPVIYMHDGQFNFHQSSSPFAGMDMFWDVDKAITRLVLNNEIRPAIVVSVWMSHWLKGARGAEYMPQKPVTDEVWQLMKKEGNNFSVEEGGDEISSDNYLKFIVTELKPFIDETYPTQSDRNNTFLVGSSMGGLISAYAISEYPEIFGAAACMSSHWPIGGGVVVAWLNDHWPPADTHRVYFDYGTETMDAAYEPYQQQMDEVMRKHGYTPGKDWITRRFDGADHSPRAWRERLHIPLKFLLSN